MEDITSAQLSEWEAFDRIDPIGKFRDELMIANFEALVLNIVNKLYAKKGHVPKLVSPVEFMPNWSGELTKLQEGKKQSVEEMKSVLMSFAKDQNKRVEREKRLTNKKPPTKSGRK